jgi:hypothetical protein
VLFDVLSHQSEVRLNIPTLLYCITQVQNFKAALCLNIPPKKSLRIAASKAGALDTLNRQNAMILTFHANMSDILSLVSWQLNTST